MQPSNKRPRKRCPRFMNAIRTLSEGRPQRLLGVLNKHGAASSAAASSGQAAKQPTARVTPGAHRPTALNERQLQRLLRAKHERGSVDLRAAASSA
jgi:hypothetical protein